MKRIKHTPRRISNYHSLKLHINRFIDIAHNLLEQVFFLLGTKLIHNPHNPVMISDKPFRCYCHVFTKLLVLCCKITVFYPISIVSIISAILLKFVLASVATSNAGFLTVAKINKAILSTFYFIVQFIIFYMFTSCCLCFSCCNLR